jgi:hypothetical protein
MAAMDDASRGTWSSVFFTLGCTLAVGALARWVRWDNTGPDGSAPQVIWTLGFFALGFFLVALQLRLPIWMRRWAESQAAEAPRSDWVDQ